MLKLVRYAPIIMIVNIVRKAAHSMGRRSVHSPEELRQLILDASQTIVERSGITGLSAREIARMIGYSPGTLYNIFENLDDILLTLQVQLQARTVEHLKRVPFGPDGEKNIEALTQAYVDFALANRRMWNLFLAHSLPPGSTMPAFSDNINKIAAIVRASGSATRAQYVARKARRHGVGALDRNPRNNRRCCS